jgi:hypothetical protein
MHCFIRDDQLSLLTRTFLLVWRSRIELHPDSCGAVWSEARGDSVKVKQYHIPPCLVLCLLQENRSSELFMLDSPCK